MTSVQPPQDPTGTWCPVTTPDGRVLQILVPPEPDSIGDLLMRGVYGFPAPFVLGIDLLEEGDVVLDLGGHLGTFALLAAASRCQVIAVEASPRNAECLKASARRNGLDITVVNVAVSDRPGVVRFRQRGAHGEVTTGTGPDVVTVPATTVPAILQDLGLETVDFIKMDIEGSEPAAIAGMRDLLAAPDAPQVVFESNSHTLRHFGTRPQTLFRAFHELGFQLLLLDWPNLVPMRPDSFQPETVSDILAVKSAPALKPPWRIDRPWGEEEDVRRAIFEAASPNPDERAAIAHAMSYCHPSLYEREDVRTMLAALAVDPHDSVADAASWWTGERPRSLDGLRANAASLRETAEGLSDRIARIRSRWVRTPS